MSNTFEEITSNPILWAAAISWFCAHTIKFLLEFIKHKKFDWRQYLTTGGMPSSHTAFVMSMATSVGLHEGFDSPMFAIAAVVTIVVMYDAQGVRRAAGKQAEVINMIVENIENSGIILDKKLKELLGHTPIEVAAGALLGIVVAVLFNGNSRG